MPDTTHDILVKARELITPPERWTQHRLARNKNGRTVLAKGSTAVCWCSYGAIKRVAATARDLARASIALDCQMGGDIGGFNDSHTHAEVLAGFDRAIAATQDHAP